MSKQNNKICNKVMKIKKLLIKRIIKVKKVINRNKNNITNNIMINQKIKLRKYEWNKYKNKRKK